MFHQRKNKSEKKIGYFVHILKCYNILICTKGNLKGFVTEDMLEVIDNSFNFVLYTNKKKKKNCVILGLFKIFVQPKK